MTKIDNLKDKKLLVIVESPNKCKHIKEYLQQAGYKKVIVEASIGHIMQLADDKASYKNSGIYPDKEFDLNLKVAQDKAEIVRKLKQQVEAADYVAIMSDPDREGFVIAWSLIKFLKIPKNKYFRAITHEITPKAVVNAIENPIEMDLNLVDAGLSRMSIDKLIGYSLSGIAKTYVGAKSVGRCQSAGLKLICDREREIQEFKPEEYFNLYLSFEKNSTKFKAKYVGTNDTQVDRFKTKNEVEVVKLQCIKDYIIEGISKKEKQESPKPPFCTSTFQQEANSKLNLTVKDAMSCAQKLFEAGLITYMRTDDTEFSPEFVPLLKNYICDTYGKTKFVEPRKGKKQENAQEGHECLRITDPSLTPDKFLSINPNTLLQKVYKIIWQRTVAACLPNAIISETGYLIDNNNHKFLLVSNEVVNEGYRTVYSYKDDEDNTEENGPVKETFTKGEKLEKCKLEDVAKQTTPPARFTEASLIKKLQSDGIGRPSTYATIVETVLSESRGYATLEDKKMAPTDRGMQLSAFLDRAFSSIINLNYTKEMEEHLDLIANGKLNKISFLQEFFTNLETAINANTETGPKQANKVCPNCGAPMAVRRSKFGTLFYGCTNYPKCKTTESIN